MTAQLQNVEHKRGKYRVIRFGPVKNPHGDLIALTGASATWRLAKSALSGTGDVLLTKDTGSSGGAQIVVGDWYGQPTYTVVVTLESEDTLTVPVCTPPNRYYHECEVTTAEGKPITVATGWFDLQPSITN